MFVAIAAFLGAIFNRIRGQGFKDPFLEAIHQFLQPLVFGLVVYVAFHDTTRALLAPIVMYLGQRPGWGSYINAILLGIDIHRAEVPWIDKMWKWLEQPKTITLWGICTLSTRGLYWGALLAIVTWNPWSLLGGALMGPTYFVTDRILKRISPKINTWAASEFVFGSILWASCFI
jgi:uncharacterized membrane protein